MTLQLPNPPQYYSPIDQSQVRRQLQQEDARNVKKSPINDGYVFANETGAAAVPQGYSLTSLFDYVFGNAHGSVLYRGSAGWTLLSPGTVNGVLATGGAGANPAWTLTPNVTSIQFGSGTALNDYEEGTWTPTDASGASLVFSSVVATYTKTGRWKNIAFLFQYPTTASPLNAQTGSLPFSINQNQMIACGFMGGVFGGCQGASGTNLSALYTYSEVPQTNADLSTKYVQANGGYI